jgi:hypothetical protein
MFTRNPKSRPEARDDSRRPSRPIGPGVKTDECQTPLSILDADSTSVVTCPGNPVTDPRWYGAEFEPALAARRTPCSKLAPNQRIYETFKAMSTSNDTVAIGQPRVKLRIPRRVLALTAAI